MATETKTTKTARISTPGGSHGYYISDADGPRDERGHAYPSRRAALEALRDRAANRETDYTHYEQESGRRVAL